MRYKKTGSKPHRLPQINRKSQAHRLAFRVPATGVISSQFLEDLERIWALRDVIPNPYLHSKQ